LAGHSFDGRARPAGNRAGLSRGAVPRSGRAAGTSVSGPGERRRVVIAADEAGTAQLWAYLPAEGAATLRAAIEAVATDDSLPRPRDSTTSPCRRTSLSRCRSTPASRS
jgi:hypothetical protein